MDTLLQFLSNYINVWIVNAALAGALLTVSVLRWRDKRKPAVTIDSIVAAWHDQYPKLSSIWPVVYGPAEAERRETLVLSLWRGGASIDECSTLTELETDAVCLILTAAGLLPADVLETIENPMVPTDNSDSMLRHLHRSFDDHVSVYEDWRDNGTSLLTDHRPKVKTKDKRTPMQLIRQDTAGYMD